MAKKFLLMAALLMFSIAAYAQKISVKIDDFTGEKMVETSWEKIYSGGATASMQTRLEVCQYGADQFLKFRIYTGKVCSIDRNAEVLFKTNDGIVKAIVTEYSLSEPGAWSVNAPNKNLGIFFSTKVNLKELIGKEIQRIRFPFSKGNVDIEIKKGDAEKMQKMFNLVVSQ